MLFSPVVCFDVQQVAGAAREGRAGRLNSLNVCALAASAKSRRRALCTTFEQRARRGQSCRRLWSRRHSVRSAGPSAYRARRLFWPCVYFFARDHVKDKPHGCAGFCVIASTKLWQSSWLLRRALSRDHREQQLSLTCGLDCCPLLSSSDCKEQLPPSSRPALCKYTLQGESVEDQPVDRIGEQQNWYITGVIY